jgi:hypothetical protein
LVCMWVNNFKEKLKKKVYKINKKLVQGFGTYSKGRTRNCTMSPSWALTTTNR